MKTKVGAQNFYVIKKVDPEVVNWGNGRKRMVSCITRPNSIERLSMK